MKTKPKEIKNVKIGRETIRTDAETDELIQCAMVATGNTNKSELLLKAVKVGLPAVVLNVQEEQARVRREQQAFWKSKIKGNA